MLPVAIDERLACDMVHDAAVIQPVAISDLQYALGCVGTVEGKRTAHVVGAFDAQQSLDAHVALFITVLFFGPHILFFESYNFV